MAVDSNVIDRLQSTLYDMRNKLLADSEVRKLLYYSASDLKSKKLEEMKDISQADVEDNIYLQQIINLDTEPPFNKRNFIAIHLSNGSCSDTEVMSYAINVMVMSEKHDWLVNGDIRPLRLAQKVVTLFDSQKFAMSNPLYFSRITQQIVNDDVYGYTLIFAASDGAHSVK